MNKKVTRHSRDQLEAIFLLSLFYLDLSVILFHVPFSCNLLCSQIYWLIMYNRTLLMKFSPFCVLLSSQEGATKEDIDRLPKFKFQRTPDVEKVNGEIQESFGGVMIECNSDPPAERVLSQEDAVSFPYVYQEVLNIYLKWIKIQNISRFHSLFFFIILLWFPFKMCYGPK